MAEPVVEIGDEAVGACGNRNADEVEVFAGVGGECMNTHIFLRKYDQGYLSNPPNVHLKVRKSAREIGSIKDDPRYAERLGGYEEYPLGMETQYYARFGMYPMRQVW